MGELDQLVEYYTIKARYWSKQAAAPEPAIRKVQWRDPVEDPPATDEEVESVGLSLLYSGTPECCRPRSARVQDVSRHPMGRPDMFDSHCHAGQAGSMGHVRKVKARMVVCATCEEDWSVVSDVCRVARRDAVPAYGLHPWYAHKARTGWYDRLRELLLATPNAIVGEIGIDKVFRPPDTRKNEFEAQLPALRAQLRLAHELRRPASVHCVACPGKLADLFEECARDGVLPPAMAIHSWGGSEDFVGILSKAAAPCPLYFGFSEVINHVGGDHRKRTRLEANVRVVSDERLLLESDLDDARFIDRDMRNMCDIVARAKGWKPEHVAEVSRENAERFVAAGRAP